MANYHGYPAEEFILKLKYNYATRCFLGFDKQLFLIKPPESKSRNWILEGCRKHNQIITSHQRCSVRKGVLRNFTKFTRKHLCQSLFFDKVSGVRPATLLEGDSGTGVFV